MTCSFDDFKSETIFFDSQSIKVYHPDTINYSTETLLGQPYAINADSVQKHLIQNPSNYSWSVVPRYSFYLIYSLSRRTNPNGNWSVYYQDRNWGNVNEPFSNLYLKATDQVIFNTITQSSLTFECYVPNNIEVWVKTRNNNYNFDSYSHGAYVYGGYKWDVSVYSNDNLWDLKVIDGSDSYYYPISNLNSVQVIYSSGSKKITVNGKKFDLIDESSIRIECTDPIGHCPTGTIECECGSNLCCYQLKDGIYRVVQEIPL